MKADCGVQVAVGASEASKVKRTPARKVGCGIKGRGGGLEGAESGAGVGVWEGEGRGLEKRDFWEGRSLRGRGLGRWGRDLGRWGRGLGEGTGKRAPRKGPCSPAAAR